MGAWLIQKREEERLNSALYSTWPMWQIIYYSTVHMDFQACMYIYIHIFRYISAEPAMQFSHKNIIIDKIPLICWQYFSGFLLTLKLIEKYSLASFWRYFFLSSDICFYQSQLYILAFNEVRSLKAIESQTRLFLWRNNFSGILKALVCTEMKLEIWILWGLEH